MNSIGAHLTVAAVPVSRWIEQARTARYRTIQIQADAHTTAAADPLPRDLRDALDRIHGHSISHSYEAARQSLPAVTRAPYRAAPAT